MDLEILLKSREYLLEDIENTKNQSSAILAMKAKMRGVTPEALKEEQLSELNGLLEELDADIEKFKSLLSAFQFRCFRYKMVRARLHVICGNCGAKDMFEHEIANEIDDDAEDEGVERQVVYISCKNCNTVHSLEDYSDPIK